VNNTLNNTVISWSDSFETKTVTGESTQSTTYYFINSELVAKKNPDSSRYYFHNDHLSSSTIVTNSGGTPIEQTKYDPWGDILSGGTKSKFLYTGQEKDTETNLNYYNARYYSSDMRRFTQPDDIYPDLYNPQTLNRYSYVNNNPLRYTDPSGHIFKELFNAVVGYVVGKAINHYVSTIFMPAPKIQSVPVSNTSNSKQTGAVPNTNGSRNTKSGNYTVPKAPTGISLTDNVQQAYNNRLNPLWFPSMVRSNGAWDYKSTHGIDSADFGNYNYGATGKASGYSSNTLKGAAGLVQQFEKYKNIFVGRESAIPTKGVPFLVDPNGDAVDSLGFSKDQYMIEQGFSSY
jgi:RHS repeat-associated protein